MSYFSLHSHVTRVNSNFLPPPPRCTCSCIPTQTGAGGDADGDTGCRTFWLPQSAVSKLQTIPTHQAPNQPHASGSEITR